MLLFIDSFDHYATADITEKWTQIYANGTSPTIGACGRRSSNGMQWSLSGGACGRAVSIVPPNNAASDTCVVGFSFVMSSGDFGELMRGNALYPTDGQVSTSLDDGPASVLIYVRQFSRTSVAILLMPNGQLSAVTGIPGSFTTENYTVLDTTRCALRTNQTYYIELKVVHSTTVGTVELRVNGDVWMALTGQNTVGTFVPAITATWDEVAIGRLKPVSGAAAHVYAIDDLYIANGDATDTTNTVVDFMGDQMIYYMPPTSDVTTAWTRSSGASNFDMVDDTVPDDAATYNYTTAAGNVDTFGVGALALTGFNVTGMQVIFSRMRLAAGSTSTQAVWRVGGTNYVKPAQGDASSFMFHWGIWNKNPATIATIVEGDISSGASSVGYKKVT